MKFNLFHFGKKPYHHNEESETFLNCNKVKREVSNNLIPNNLENCESRNVGVSVLRQSQINELFNLRFFTQKNEVPFIKYEGCVLNITRGQGQFLEVNFCPINTGYISLSSEGREAKVCWEKIEGESSPTSILKEEENCFKVKDFEGREVMLWVYEDMAVIEEVLKEDEKQTHRIKKQAIAEILEFNEIGCGDWEKYKENLETLSKIKEMPVEDIEKFIWGFTTNFGNVTYH